MVCLPIAGSLCRWGSSPAYQFKGSSLCRCSVVVRCGGASGLAVYRWVAGVAVSLCRGVGK